MRTFIGLLIIAFGIFVEVTWLGFCFGSIIIGILLLIFVPSILFFPFSFSLIMGLKVMGDKSYVKYSRYGGRAKYQYTYFKPKVNNDEYYAVLESSKDDDFATIKKNYRRLMKEYHYDSVASQDLDEATLKIYEEKSQKINEAYDFIKKSRN